MKKLLPYVLALTFTLATIQPTLACDGCADTETGRDSDDSSESSSDGDVPIIISNGFFWIIIFL